ncbi:MAG: rhodanese-like domain-containing protein [Clostridium sp.]
MFPFLFDKTMEEVKQELDNNENIQLIDVREPYEYEEAHIPGAWLLPLNELEQKADNILQEDKKYYVYCRSGQRSRTAVRKLKAIGYKDVYNIGGIIHWPYDKKTGKNR